MGRLFARVARWSLPVALLVATLVAVVGLGGVLFPRPDAPPPAPAVALNLSSAPALPAADDGAALTPQQLPAVDPVPALTPQPPCPAPRPCPRPASADDRADCCR